MDHQYLAVTGACGFSLVVTVKQALKLLLFTLRLWLTHLFLQIRVALLCSCNKDLAH